MTAPFAKHPLDHQRAATYLPAAVKAEVTWVEAEEDIRQYLNEQGCSEAHIAEEVKRAKPYLEPWLR